MKAFMKTALCAALAVAALAGLTGCSAAPTAAIPASESASEITVSASSTVRLTPDKATVSFGVSTQEQTAELAQAANSEAVKRVIAVLTDRGIEEKSIRTTNYSMYPQYDYSADGERIIGYAVYTTMSVQDQNIEDLGSLLSACVAAGINNVDSVSFLCSGYDEAYRQALAQAVAASREKAETLAAASGKRLADVVGITEGWQDTSARYGRSANTSVEMLMDKAELMPSFQPGESEIVANVTVTYRMQ